LNESLQSPAAQWPAGTETEHVTFVIEPPSGQPVLAELPGPGGKHAVLVRRAAPDPRPRPVPAGDLLVLSVPAPEHEDVELLARVRDWVDSAVPETGPASQMVALHGAQVFWAQGCVALVAPPERRAAVRRALIEFAHVEAELCAIEADLSVRWPELEADAPLAFEFDEKATRKKKQLAQRFLTVLSLRARLARVTPQVLCPHVHPPTLASQIGERLRERTRLAQRLEFAGGQLEVFERVYEQCGQRASDFGLARTGHTLEWIIIVLLFAQIVLVSVELMAALGK
jgi:hypothetical protein